MKVSILSHFGRGVALVCTTALVSNSVFAETTTTWFGNKGYNINRIFINPYNGSSPPTGSTYFSVNNLYKPGTESFQVSSLFDGGTYTGLSVPSGSQAISTSGGIVKSGDSLFQANESHSGIYLDLKQVSSYPFQLPNSSMQMIYNFKYPKSIWAKSMDTMFCASGQMDLHTSTLGSNPNLSNQQNIAFLFQDTSVPSGHQFWYSMALYESRTFIIPQDFVMADNPNDTNLPIVLGFAKSQNGIGAFVRDIPTYGNPLRAFYEGANQPGLTDVGGCIQRDQFLAAINYIRSKYPTYADMSTDLSKYQLKHFNLDLEIYHNYTSDRSLGMNVEAFWIYNRNDAPQSTPQYGFFLGSSGGNNSLNTLWACNVSGSRQNLGGWIQQNPPTCYQQYVPELNATGNATNNCSSKTAYCNSFNRIEEVACGCPAALGSPWTVNNQLNGDGSVFQTCYRYQTNKACIY